MNSKEIVQKLNSNSRSSLTISKSALKRLNKLRGNMPTWQFLNLLLDVYEQQKTEEQGETKALAA